MALNVYVRVIMALNAMKEMALNTEGDKGGFECLN